MEHLLLNSRTLFALFALVAWVIQKISVTRKAAAAAQQGRPVVRDAHGQAVDPEAEARTRRVREEVARKIAQRKNILMMPSARPEAPQAPNEAEGRPTLPPFAPRIAVEAPPPLSPPPAPIFAAPPSPIFVPHLPDLVPSARPANVWLEQLRQPDGFRRAIILREILGPPVGLR